MGNHCCPNCGNRDLQAINQTNVQTHGSDFSASKGCLGFLLFGPLGILCGSCGQGKQTTTTNQTYWTCNKCGHKFRDINEQRAEVESQKNAGGAMAVISAILFIVGFIVGIANDFGFISIFLMIFSAAMFFSGIAISLNSSSKMEEIDSIETRMAKYGSSNSSGYNKTQSGTNNTGISSWNCSKCNTNNSSSVRHCVVCGNSRVVQKDKQAGENEWKCPKCGRVNQNYVGTCGCGELKTGRKITVSREKNTIADRKASTTESVVSEKTVATDVEKVEVPTKEDKKFSVKFCPNCGTENIGSSFCPNCGTNLKEVYTSSKNNH